MYIFQTVRYTQIHSRDAYKGVPPLPSPSKVLLLIEYIIILMLQTDLKLPAGWPASKWPALLQLLYCYLQVVSIFITDSTVIHIPIVTGLPRVKEPLGHYNVLLGLQFLTDQVGYILFKRGSWT